MLFNSSTYKGDLRDRCMDSILGQSLASIDQTVPHLAEINLKKETKKQVSSAHLFSENHFKGISDSYPL